MGGRLTLGLVALVLAPVASGDGWISDEERERLCDARLHPFPTHSKRSVRWLHVPKTVCSTPCSVLDYMPNHSRVHFACHTVQGTSFMNTVWHYACRLPPGASASDFDAMFEKRFAQRYPPRVLCDYMLDHSPATHKPVGDLEWQAHRGAFVTMLREPALRLVSAFNHGRHCIQDCSPETSQVPPCAVIRDSRRLYRCKPLQMAKNAREYAAEPEARGCAARMIVGRACNEPVELKENETALALDRLLGGFAFVGLVEEWNLSVCLFHRLLGGSPLPLEFTAVRVNNGTAGKLQRRPTLLSALRDPADEVLYNVASTRFRAQVQSVLASLRR
jgi:hypothetical protein